MGLIVAHRPSRGQPASVVRRVGVLLTTSEATNAPLRAAFNQAMRDLGWIEGTNVEYRIVSANGDVDRLDALANELIRQNVEVVVAASSAGTRAAQRATKMIPIVMVAASNALDSGFVASLAKPGGNITGVSNQREEALQKLIEILHEVLPDARRIGIRQAMDRETLVSRQCGRRTTCKRRPDDGKDTVTVARDPLHTLELSSGNELNAGS